MGEMASKSSADLALLLYPDTVGVTTSLLRPFISSYGEKGPSTEQADCSNMSAVSL